MVIHWKFIEVAIRLIYSTLKQTIVSSYLFNSRCNNVSSITLFINWYIAHLQMMLLYRV